MRRPEEPRRAEDLLARLHHGLSAPSEHDLRAMARAATSRSRPLPPPVSSRGGLSARGIGVVGLALAAAVALGLGLGTLLAPTGTAAVAVGTGFLPQPGWTVLQTGEDATAERQALSVATNVRLHPEDHARGIRGSSGLPYSTLLELPERGVVIVGLFTRRESEPWNDEFFPERVLPLRVRDALSSISYSYQMRPERPLGQYELRATVGDHHVVLHFYFGSARPSPQILAAAQRQLDRLVVASVFPGEADAGPPTVATEPWASKIIHRPAQPAKSRVVDQTVVCAISPGNPREINVTARSGTRLFGDRSRWKTLPGVSFGDPSATSPTSPGVSAGVSAGWPPVTEIGVPLRTEALRYSVRCRPSKARVSLTTSGLPGAVAGQNGDNYDCVVPGRILVRIRSVFYAPTWLRRWRPTRYIDELVARGRSKEGALAIRTESGKPVAVATVHESGRARLFVGPSCGPSA